jgi:DNA-binding transcriptional ArsR family regulator
MVPGDPARAIADVLRAVAHPVRLRLIEILCGGEAHVSALVKQLGVAQPIVSQQLRVLRLHGLVAVTRDAGFARYRLAEESLRDLVACMSRCRAATMGSDRFAAEK